VLYYYQVVEYEDEGAGERKREEERGREEGGKVSGGTWRSGHS
jgi:hypothetical protein